MGERVRAQGGRLTTGQVAHGFRVAAELPLGPAS
jgi:signal transduction histidine kinase